MFEQFIVELQKSVGLFKPEIALAATLGLAIIFDLIFKKSKFAAGIITIAGFIATFIFLAIQPSETYGAFSNTLAIDSFATFFKFVVLIASFLVVLMSFFYDELNAEGRSVGEYYTIIVGMTFGMFLLVGANNLLLMYLAIEIMSMSSYVLAGYTKEVKRASEASLKYVIYGAASSGVALYGMSILYGLTGTLNFGEINAFLASHSVNSFALTTSVVMILVVVGYKISAVPFHFWTPDVYEGAPVTITALLSVASKAAGFAILVRFVKVAFVDSSAGGTGQAWAVLNGFDWSFVIAVLSVLTMTLGNLIALWQTNVKRLLAYSSIAHAGYILMGLAALTDTGVIAALIYFVFYTLMNLGAFFVVQLIANKIGSEELDDYKGIGYRAPVLGVSMVIFLVSLTGLPPAAGFIGKLFLFTAVIKAGYVWLAVIGALNSVVSLYYYVKVMKYMFVKNVEENEFKEKYTFSPASVVLLMVFAVPTLLFIVYYSPVVQWANNSLSMFLG